jgi:uncharacterized repeat protein (TIGR01451 family)
MGVVIGNTTIRRGFLFHYGLRCDNKGTTTENSIVRLFLSPDVAYDTCLNNGNYDVENHTITWYFSNFAPGACIYTSARVRLSPLFPIGSVISAIAQIEPVIGDVDPSDNTDTVNQVVRGSYDPNEKYVNPETDIYSSDLLTYHIDFQNVGTDTAFNIVIRDTLDSNLDIATLMFRAGSHQYTYDLKDREIIWTFANVCLPDSNIDQTGSNGFVEFSIYPLPNLPYGTIIQNKALVFFDYNPPVVTNSVINTIVSPPCEYVQGDINGDHLRGGGDVTYGVRFFKLIGNRPPDSCYMDSTSSYLYVAGDVNGNCEFRGSDISRLVAYFKLIAALQYCHFFPPPPMRESRKAPALRD